MLSCPANDQNYATEQNLIICICLTLHRFSGPGVPHVLEAAAVFYGVKDLRLQNVCFKLLLDVGVERRVFVQLSLISYTYLLTGLCLLFFSYNISMPHIYAPCINHFTAVKAISYSLQHKN